MTNNIFNCLTNPVKCKLLIDIQSAGEMTTKQLAEIHPDIPPATMYRHLNRMASDGILLIAAENKVRGTVEKVYTVAPDLSVNAKKMIEENSGEMYMLMFSQFIAGLTHEFQDYCKRDSINILEDGSGFSLAPVYATNNELEEAMKKIGETITGLLRNQPTAERKLRSIATILTPPKNQF